eukprot:TRINITY_DN19275_c0_g1_i2.p1 TRINITY_DN19275_c0_g1~~TRINITY_DN19275_c0_g1_i2.p1  ORF type:complete len:971 (-),score=199.89 TRINITY_DN19275_c0_g1_i2:316-3033(-)
MVSPGSYHGFKVSIAVIICYFAVKMLEQFADILLPFIMALLLVSVLEPVKQVTLSLLEATLLVLFRNIGCCSCLLRAPARGNSASQGEDSRGTSRTQVDLHDTIKRFLLLVSIAVTFLLAARVFWVVCTIVWLSSEAVIHDFHYYQMGVAQRGHQLQALLKRFHLEDSVHFDAQDAGDLALSVLRYAAEFLTQHVFYTATQIALTTIFVLFLLYSPVQREDSPVMQGVFGSMELYLKLKTYISILMGVTNGVMLAIIGFELPAAWGLLTFLVNFIPNVGGPSISILTCAIALLDVRKTMYQVFAGFMAQLVLHGTIANFVEPVVFGTTEEIHSVVVLLGLSFFGYIWGITGMFLSVPLLFAIHAWFGIIVRTPKYPVEAREDARFIMGMLEGRWLSDSVDGHGEDQSGTSLLTGHIDALGSDGTGDHMAQLPGGTHHSQPAQSTEGSFALTTMFQDCFRLYYPETGEVRFLGLLMRWIILTLVYTFVLFGFSIFGFDLSILIHPSEDRETATAMNDPRHFDSVASTTSSTTSMTTVVAAAVTTAVTTAAPLLLKSTIAPSETDAVKRNAPVSSRHTVGQTAVGRPARSESTAAKSADAAADVALAVDGAGGGQFLAAAEGRSHGSDAKATEAETQHEKKLGAAERRPEEQGQQHPQSEERSQDSLQKMHSEPSSKKTDMKDVRRKAEAFVSDLTMPDHSLSDTSTARPSATKAPAKKESDMKDVREKVENFVSDLMPDVSTSAEPRTQESAKAASSDRETSFWETTSLAPKTDTLSADSSLAKDMKAKDDKAKTSAEHTGAGVVDTVSSDQEAKAEDGSSSQKVAALNEIDQATDDQQSAVRKGKPHRAQDVREPSSPEAQNDEEHSAKESNAKERSPEPTSEDTPNDEPSNQHETHTPNHADDF